MNPQYDTFIAPGSAQPSRPQSDKKFFLIIFAVIAVVLVIGGAMLFLSSGSDSTDDLLKLNQNLSALNSLTTESNSYLRSESLASFNSELQLTMTSQRKTLANNLGLGSIAEEQLAPTIRQDLDTLSSANSTNTYNQAYKQVVSSRIASILTTSKQLYTGAKNDQTKQTLNDLYTDFSVLKARLDEIKL